MDQKIRELRLEKRKLVKSQKYYGDKLDNYRRKYYEFDAKAIKAKNEIAMLMHKYSKGDWVVTTNEFADGTEEFAIAQIRKLIGSKMYEVFEYFMGGGCGTAPTIHEDRIVCKVSSINAFFELKRRNPKKQRK